MQFANSINHISSFDSGRVLVYGSDRTIQKLVKEDDQNAVITVKDWGIGMDESTITKLGDPFFTTKDPGKGTGLGLYIAYQCVEVHNGSIQFESTPGEGTKCVITIPVAS